MGDIKEILAEIEFDGQPLFGDKLRIESSEAIHIHWRDLRILATVNQFMEIGEGFKRAFGTWNGNLSENDITLSETTIPEDIIFENKGKIEEQNNGVIHFHYRDIRLELTVKNFLLVAFLFNKAREGYLLTRKVIIPLEDINLYDKSHFATEKEWNSNKYLYHQEGITLVKKGIIQGRIIRPIAVANGEKPYQRMDGFKRYMAYKELEMRKIPCYLLEPNDIWPGFQHNESWFLD